MPTAIHASDAMVRRLQQELNERNAAAQGIISTAQDAERDLNAAETETLGNLRGRMGEIKAQLDELESTAEMAGVVSRRMDEIDRAAITARRVGSSEIEYRSAGEWAMDTYKASLGDREAKQRMEVFYRAAEHNKTSDNLGVVPDPVVGNVINFIDSARPLVNVLGPMPIPSASWHRPLVTQHTQVAVQGSAGAAADEKAELESQKMTITRLNATAKTYGGYVNVSRQNIDFSAPQIMDLIIGDLAAQYAIQTEAATAAALEAATTAGFAYGTTPTSDDVSGALWSAVGAVYNATKGQGRLILAVAADVLGTFGPLFAPVNPQNAQSPGFTAANFGQGVMGSIGGVSVVMSAGLSSGSALVFSTAAVEVFEQRIGTLQVTEPSVLGVQVAYAGYFTALTVNAAAIVPLVETGS